MALNVIVQSTSLTETIETARRRSIAWLDSMQTAGEPRGVMRISSHHDATRWPDMLLPGTYNGLLCRHLIEGLGDFSGPEQVDLVRWLEGFRIADGRFRMGSMKDDDVFKKPDKAETWRYIDFHITNYTLGAIEALDPGRRPVLDFALPYLDERTLGHWLSIRDLRDPWQEGNNIVNLASFLLLLRRHGEGKRSGNDLAPAVDGALARLFEWHERLQEPATGFWGVGQLSDATRLKDAFAGSMHNFHIWYEAGRPLPFQERAIDYCLSLPPKVDSACIDVDAVDLLAHAWRLLDYRRGDIEAWLAALLPALLADQNPDGGFCDVREGMRRQDGWVGGYEEPQGLSNTFATWFRWIAIAMIADILFPDQWRWRFRRMIGIGYRMPEEALVRRPAL
jgi:hypothetical protein